MYNVDFDPVAKRLMLRLSGFWSDETMTSFEKALTRTLATVDRIKIGFDTLSDASDFPVQSAATSTRFGALMTAMTASRRGKLAIVVASTLNKMQAERALGGPNIRVFLDRPAAVRWLAGEG